MPATSYKVFQWGNRVGAGAMASVNVAVSGVAKTSTPELPLAVVNELICADLARAVRLPIPPSFLVHDKDAKPYHVSLNFHLSGEDLPPADAAAIATDFPELACGVILFDMWVCNSDRHASNIAYDKAMKQVTLFDHSHAFLHGQQGKTFLENLRSQPAIGGHCLASQIMKVDGFKTWQDRISAVPEFYIREAVQQTVGIGTMTADLAIFATDYLLDRRKRLPELIQAHRALFPKVELDLWDEPKGGG
jgi:uncharacterized tellurite resistance protein B-like protein